MEQGRLVIRIVSGKIRWVLVRVVAEWGKFRLRNRNVIIYTVEELFEYEPSEILEYHVSQDKALRSCEQMAIDYSKRYNAVAFRTCDGWTIERGSISKSFIVDEIEVIE